MSKRRAILHIGTEKTGTTSLQSFLSRNRELLWEQGYAYPRSPGLVNHTRLAVWCADKKDTTDLSIEMPGGHERVAASFAAEFHEEMRGLPDRIHTVILSNEHCHSRIREEAGVARLKAELLDPFFDDCTIAVYLRRQDETAVSQYSTVLRGGQSAQAAVFPEVGPGSGWRSLYDFEAMLHRWARVFGREAMRVRIFARDRLERGDIVADFLAGFGIEGIQPEAVPEKQNVSLVPAAQELLRRAAEVSKPGGLPGQPTERPVRLSRFLGEEFEGPGQLPTRAEALAFQARFGEANERIRQDYFPDRASLFSEDFSRYPESPGRVGDAEVLRAALSVIGNMATELRRHYVANAMLKAQLARQEGEGRPREAVEFFETALGYSPAHGPALRGLLELAEQGVACPTLPAHLTRARAAAPERVKQWDAMEARFRRLHREAGARTPQPQPEPAGAA